MDSGYFIVNILLPDYIFADAIEWCLQNCREDFTFQHKDRMTASARAAWLRKWAVMNDFPPVTRAFEFTSEDDAILFELAFC